jgi:RNA polymerase-binding protein DksA
MVSTDLQNELRPRLEAERQRLEREIATFTTTGVGGDIFQDDETDAADQHPADDASELFEREKNLALVRNLERSLQQVNDALRKMDNGTYGICEMCGKPIAEKRLRALPEATHCIDDQARIDRLQSGA